MAIQQTQIEKSISKRKAIQYLMRVEEARRWIYNILERSMDKNYYEENENHSNHSSSSDEEIGENLEALTADEILERNIPKKKSKIRFFEEELQKGEILVELINKFCDTVDLKTYPVYVNDVKVFKHIENINFFKEGAYELGLSQHYKFDSSDCYNGRYIPDVVYFIHALGIYSSAKYGFLPIEKLREHQVQFSEEDINAKLDNADNLPVFEDLYDDMADEIKQLNAMNLVTTGIRCLINEALRKKEAMLLSNLCNCEKCKHNRNCTLCTCPADVDKVDYMKLNGNIYLDENLNETEEGEGATLYTCKGCVDDLLVGKNKICDECLHKENCGKCNCTCKCEGPCDCFYNTDYETYKGIAPTEEEKEMLKNKEITLNDIKVTEKNSCPCCIKDNIIKCTDCEHLVDCESCVCKCVCEGTCKCGNKYDYLEENGIRKLNNGEVITCEGCVNQITSFNSKGIRDGMTSFLENNAFSELIYIRKISMYSVKKFLHIFLENREYVNIDSVIESQYAKIHTLLEHSYVSESKVTDVQINLALLMANLSKSLNTTKSIPNIDNIVNIAPLDCEEYKTYQNVFYLLQAEPIILCLILKTKLMEEKEDIEILIEDFSRNVILPVFNFFKSNREENLIMKLMEFFILLNETNQNPSGINENEYFKETQVNNDYTLLIVNSIIKNYLLTCRGYENLKEMFSPVIKTLLEETTLENETSGADTKPSIEKATSLILEIFKKNIKKIPTPIVYYLMRLKSPKHFINQFLIPLFAEEFEKETKVFTKFIKQLKNKANDISNLLNILTEEDLEERDIKTANPSITLTINEANRIFKEFKLAVKTYHPVYSDLKTRSKKEVLAEMKSNTFKDNFMAVMPYLIKFYPSKYLTTNAKEEIVFYLNTPVIIKRDIVKLNQLKKNLCVLVHIPGVSIEDILLNKHWEDKEGMKKFELIYALFFCPEFDYIYAHKNYNPDVTFSKNYKTLIKDDKFKCPEIRVFKDRVLEGLRELSKTGEISANNQYNEFLPIIAAEILNIKLSGLSRLRELNITKSTIKSLQNKFDKIYSQEASILKYYRQYALNMMDTENIRNEFPKKISKYGTYRFKAADLMNKKILLRVSDFDSRNNSRPNSGVTVFISCNVPNEFCIEVSVFDVICGRLNVRLDELLLNQHRGIKVVYLREVENYDAYMGEMSNDLLINLINDKYIIA